ncbi:MAG: small, acid-soluble spore protein, alpha/beta type [Lachnospiraceae bacterium]|nr:small, acid-soluble spore protein, alpha/beta type [Lachnospiraceae bacterium]
MPKSKKTTKSPFDPAHMTPEEHLKFEIAEELGLADRVLKDGWKCLTSKESGRIGGMMTKRKRQMRDQALESPTCQKG